MGEDELQVWEETRFYGTTYEQMVSSFIGGLLLCLACSFHLQMKGRVTGMSGVLSGVLTLDSASFHWKSSLLLGMITMSSIFMLFFNENDKYFETLSEFRQGLSPFGFGLSGFLVGLGTKLSNGCTSGHGLCGIPRFSPRSLTAVGTFFVSALIVANVKDSLKDNEGWNFLDRPKKLQEPFSNDYGTNWETYVVLYVSIALTMISLIYHRCKYGPAAKLMDCLISWITGSLFAVGMVMSGMVKRHVVVDFFLFNSNWNPCLGIVFLSAVIPNILTFFLIRLEGEPLMASKFEIPKNIMEIDSKLIGGAALFGIGWGIGGICPGPSFCLIPTLFVEVIFYYFLCQAIGSLSVSLYQNYINQQQEENNKQQQQQQIPQARQVKQY